MDDTDGKELWQELLNQTKNRHIKNNEEQTVVLCTPFSSTLKTFKEEYIPTVHKSKDLALVKLINSSHIKDFQFKSAEVEDSKTKYDVNIISLISNLDAITLPLIKPFLKYTQDTKLCFLLDWTLHTQKQWLRYLVDHVEKLKELRIDIKNENISCICTNSNQIYDLQRMTTFWDSNNIDFIQQTLRSFCFLNKNNLIYTDDTMINDNGIFYRIITNRYAKKDVNMSQSTKICVPSGFDSVGLIKTLNESFDVMDVVTKEFLTERYEKTVPGEHFIRSIKEDNILDFIEKEKRKPTAEENIQAELQKIYLMNKENKISSIAQRNLT